MGEGPGLWLRDLAGIVTAQAVAEAQADISEAASQRTHCKQVLATSTDPAEIGWAEATLTVLDRDNATRLAALEAAQAAERYEQAERFVRDVTQQAPKEANAVVEGVKGACQAVSDVVPVVQRYNGFMAQARRQAQTLGGSHPQVVCDRHSVRVAGCELRPEDVAVITELAQALADVCDALGVAGGYADSLRMMTRLGRPLRPPFYQGDTNTPKETK